VSQPPGAGPRPVRTAIDRASAPALIRLSKLPKIVPFVVMLAVLVAGIFIGGIVGFLLILLAVLFLGWLLYLGWPGLTMPERLMRLAVIVLAAGLAITRLSSG
jgi:hypothetical protein